MRLLSLETFAGAAHQQFDLSLGGASTPLTLVEMKPLPVRPYPGMRRTPFSLMFRGASPVVLPQKLYSLTNPTLGQLELFLVPVGRDRAGVLYQAMFN